MSLMAALLCGPLKKCPKIRAPKKVRSDGTNFSTAEPSFAGFYKREGAPGPWPLVEVRQHKHAESSHFLGEKIFRHSLTEPTNSSQ